MRTIVVCPSIQYISRIVNDLLTQDRATCYAGIICYLHKMKQTTSVLWLRVALSLKVALPLIVTGLALLGVVTVDAVEQPEAVEQPKVVEREYYHYHSDNQMYLSLADSIIERTRARLIELVGDSLDEKPDIHIVSTLREFNRLIMGRFPDWGAAAAFPPRNLVAIKSPQEFNINKSLPELLAHEYCHLVVWHRANFNSVPRWFDEGMAMFVSMEWGWSDNLAMSKAAVFGELIPLAGIEKLNRFHEGKAQVAYSQSFLAVDYIYRNYGKSSLKRFLDVVAVGGSLDEAFGASTGSTAEEFEREFGDYLKKQYNIVTLFMDTIFFWLALAVLVIVGAILKYRKRREYYKKWEREEQLHSTDFDYGDPDRPEQTDDDEPWRD